MDPKLTEVWQTAAGSPFLPTVGKGSQFVLASTLLSAGFILAVFFALNRSIRNLPLFGIPASVAIAYGTVYLFCAVGVYV